MIRTLTSARSPATRRRSVSLILAVLLTFTAYAASAQTYEQWQYWNSINTSIKYLTEEEAHEALLAAGGVAQFLTLRGAMSTMSRDQVSQQWLAPNEEEFYTDNWTYFFGGTGTYSSEAEVIAAYEADLNNATCPLEHFQVVGGYNTEQSFLDLPIRETKVVEFKHLHSQYNFNEQIWECNPSSADPTIGGFTRTRTAACPTHYTANYAEGMCSLGTVGYTYGKPVTTCGPKVGNPCDVANGDKIIRETDYSAPGIEFKREFHSQIEGGTWRHNFSGYLVITSGAIEGVVRHTGHHEPLRFYTSTYVAYTGSGLEVRKVGDDWITYYPSGAKDYYDANGVLQKKVNPAGQATVVTHDSEGRIDQITGPFGHVLTFVYGTGIQPEKIVDPAGQEIQYEYSAGRLTKVTYPDGVIRQYHHEDLNYVTFVTGITDENGDRYATYTYDERGRTISSEHAGGFGRVSMNYNVSSTSVVDAVGNLTTWNFTTNAYRMRKVTSESRGALSKTFTYPGWGLDNQQRPIQVIDENGNITAYSHGVHHRTSMTEAFGTPEARTTNYEYLDDDHDLPTRITTPSVAGGAHLREVLTTYNANKLPTQITISGLTPAAEVVSRSTGLSYNSSGQVIQIDGPRTAVTDTTTFEYHECTTGAQCGQLKKVTNALGHITTYDSYDAHGRVLQITDPNGLKTAYTYDLRGRVLTVTQAPPAGTARVTTYTYDSAGQLKTVSTPDGVTLTYAYNAAHLLTSITDNLSNKIQYGYDLNENRTDEDVYDPNNVLVRTVDTAYDARDRVNQINSAGSITDLVFDALGNLTSEDDPLDHTTTHDYDPLNRLTQTVDALAGITGYDYDVNDNLVQVDAPNGTTTTYSYDDLGNLLQEVSPDRGTTTYTYDAAGNRITQTDAEGQATTYQYDAINRLTQASYDDGQVVTYVYDVGATGKGRLGRITDPSGQTEWDYDVFSAVTQKRQTIGTVTLTTSYTYESGGRVATMTYPSGKVVAYGYTAGQLTSMTLDGQTLLSNIAYEPFGPVSGWTWGNGTAHSRTFDQRGRLISHSLGTDTRTLTHDLAGRITDIVDSANDMDYEYDALGRLTNFASTGNPALPSSQAFTYDANGNRLTFAENGGAAETYTYQANSNRLESVSGPAARTFTYDTNGNVTGDGTHTYVYDGRNRLVSVDGGMVSYKHNGLGARVLKDIAADVFFGYDEFGQIIGEYDSAGAVRRETVFLDSGVVAVLDGDTAHQVHADHLGTARLITDGNIAIWGWTSDPFGTTTPDEDPDGDADTFTYNLRFPGQYSDAETGLHYNYFRDYNPITGGYMQSDPVGLAGGLNSFSYVDANPLRFVDPLGLDTLVVSNGQTYTHGGGNPFGHTAIATTGSGLYSYGNDAVPGSSVVDYLNRELGRRDTTLTIIKTTPEQEKKIIDYLKSLLDKPLTNEFPDYLGDNCAVRISDALARAGLPLLRLRTTGGKDPLNFYVASSATLPVAVQQQAAQWINRLGGQTIKVPMNSDLSSVLPSVQQFEP